MPITSRSTKAPSRRQKQPTNLLYYNKNLVYSIQIVLIVKANFGWYKYKNWVITRVKFEPIKNEYWSKIKMNLIWGKRTLEVEPLYCQAFLSGLNVPNRCNRLIFIEWCHFMFSIIVIGSWCVLFWVDISLEFVFLLLLFDCYWNHRITVLSIAINLKEKDILVCPIPIDVKCKLFFFLSCTLSIYKYVFCEQEIFIIYLIACLYYGGIQDNLLLKELWPNSTTLLKDLIRTIVICACNIIVLH